MSGPQVSRIEGGKKRATRSFVVAVDDFLEAGGSLISLWEDLNKDGYPVPIWFDWPQVEAAQKPAYALELLGNQSEVVYIETAIRGITTDNPGRSVYAGTDLGRVPFASAPASAVA